MTVIHVMNIRRSTAVVAAISGVLTASTVAAEHRSITCKRMLIRTSWTLRVHSGRETGSIDCAAPLGPGRYRGRLRVKSVPEKGEWFYTSRFRISLAGGALFGSLSVGRLNVFPTGGKVQQYVGAVRVTGGTGAYRHVTGLGPLVCSTRDGGIHVRCGLKLKLTDL